MTAYYRNTEPQFINIPLIGLVIILLFCTAYQFWAYTVSKETIEAAGAILCIGLFFVLNASRMILLTKNAPFRLYLGIGIGGVITAVSLSMLYFG